jgi:two-component system, NarL family, nitrate/nitrite response regulator NarL
VQDQIIHSFRHDASRPAMDTHPATKASRIRIAIADAHALFREGLRKLLSTEADFEVVAEADNAFSLMSALANCQPDVVLLATPLEGDEKQDVFAALGRLHPNTRVIVMSGSSEQDAFVKSVRAGARGIVQKSTSGVMLVKAIRKVHDGEFWLDRNTTAEVVRHFAERPAAPVLASRTATEARVPTLSRREREIVILVTHGYRNKELAEKLNISEQTVKNHMHNIFDKLGVSDRLELALYAIHHSWHEAE